MWTNDNEFWAYVTEFYFIHGRESLEKNEPLPFRMAQKIYGSEARMLLNCSKDWHVPSEPDDGVIRKRCSSDNMKPVGD
jgi:hypothetical protein